MSTTAHQTVQARSVPHHNTNLPTVHVLIVTLIALLASVVPFMNAAVVVMDYFSWMDSVCLLVLVVILPPVEHVYCALIIVQPVLVRPAALSAIAITTSILLPISAWQIAPFSALLPWATTSMLTLAHLVQTLTLIVLSVAMILPRQLYLLARNAQIALISTWEHATPPAPTTPMPPPTISIFVWIALQIVWPVTQLVASLARVVKYSVTNNAFPHVPVVHTWLLSTQCPLVSHAAAIVPVVML